MLEITLCGATTSRGDPASRFDWEQLTSLQSLAPQPCNVSNFRGDTPTNQQTDDTATLGPCAPAGQDAPNLPLRGRVVALAAFVARRFRGSYTRPALGRSAAKRAR